MGVSKRWKTNKAKIHYTNVPGTESDLHLHEKRARKDRHEREKRLIKAQYFMDNPMTS